MTRFLAWLRVPPEPQPPAGSPGSLQVFRAGRNYLRLRILVWAGAQIGAIFGVFATLAFIHEIEIQKELDRAREERVALTPGTEPADPVFDPANSIHRGPFHQTLYDLAPHWLRELPKRIPAWAVKWIKLGEAIGIVGFVFQFTGSLLAVLVDFRLRWYMVTDRSLRLRWGVFNIQESTMSFANLQQVAVHQGPLQRLLGLADVEVRSAGGGSGGKDHDEDDSMHRSVFHAVDNAKEIRDLILSRLQRFRQAGLGDPDDAHDVPAANAHPMPPADDISAVTAAREVLAEIRSWRASPPG